LKCLTEWIVGGLCFNILMQINGGPINVAIYVDGYIIMNIIISATAYPSMQ